jgi:hypothetical protein
LTLDGTLHGGAFDEVKHFRHRTVCVHVDSLDAPTAD